MNTLHRLSILAAVYLMMLFCHGQDDASADRVLAEFLAEFSKIQELSVSAHGADIMERWDEMERAGSPIYRISQLPLAVTDKALAAVLGNSNLRLQHVTAKKLHLLMGEQCLTVLRRHENPPQMLARWIEIIDTNHSLRTRAARKLKVQDNPLLAYVGRLMEHYPMQPVSVDYAWAESSLPYLGRGNLIYEVFPVDRDVIVRIELERGSILNKKFELSSFVYTVINLAHDPKAGWYNPGLLSHTVSLEDLAKAPLGPLPEELDVSKMHQISYSRLERIYHTIVPYEDEDLQEEDQEGIHITPPFSRRDLGFLRISEWYRDISTIEESLSFWRCLEWIARQDNAGYWDEYKKDTLPQEVFEVLQFFVERANEKASNAFLQNNYLFSRTLRSLPENGIPDKQQE